MTDTACESQAIASPLSLDSRTVTPDVSLTGRSAPEVGIKWTGSIFPGEEPTELWGDAHVCPAPGIRLDTFSSH